MITLEEAIKKCNDELAFAIHMEECAPNPGLQVIYSNRAEWLSQVLYAAREYQKDTESSIKRFLRGIR
jgi:hypothetical protein